MKQWLIIGFLLLLTWGGFSVHFLVGGFFLFSLGLYINWFSDIPQWDR